MEGQPSSTVIRLGSMNWAIGMQGIGISEYYLRTGDQTLLPMLQKGADYLRDHIMADGPGEALAPTPTRAEDMSIHRGLTASLTFC